MEGGLKMKKTKQKIYYDKKTDVLWIFVKSGPEDEHREVAPGISVELDKKGELLGIEILDASKILGSKLAERSQEAAQSAAIPHKIS